MENTLNLIQIYSMVKFKDLVSRGKTIKNILNGDLKKQ